MHTDQRHSASRAVLHRGWTSAARDALQHVKHSTTERESGISDAPFHGLSSALRGCGVRAQLCELSAVACLHSLCTARELPTRRPAAPAVLRATDRPAEEWWIWSLATLRALRFARVVSARGATPAARVCHASPRSIGSRKRQNGQSW
jgi:hypothetical protein